MAIEHTKNKYYGDWANRAPDRTSTKNGITEKAWDMTPSEMKAHREKYGPGHYFAGPTTPTKKAASVKKASAARRPVKASSAKSSTSYQKFTPKEVKATNEAVARVNNKVPSSRFLGTDVGRGVASKSPVKESRRSSIKRSAPSTGKSLNYDENSDTYTYDKAASAASKKSAPTKKKSLRYDENSDTYAYDGE